MKLKVLGSSSSGNCYILETETGTLILDAGIRFKDIQIALDFYLSDVHGCLVTHEHSDHSKAVKDVLRAAINVYASMPTLRALGITERHLAVSIKSNEQFTVGDFIVLSFPTEHDAAEPLGFLIQYKPTGERILFATDTYFIRHRFNGLNYILIESNYCKDILDANVEAGKIPSSLKKRILESHFSLDNLKGFLDANDLREVRKIVLIHLSDSNSDAARMVREIKELTGKDTEIAEAGKVIPLELCPF